jgi:hypothetical protein
MKKQMNCRVDTNVQDAIKKEAEQENRRFGNHVETILKKHIAKKEQVKHTPKKENNE